MMMNDQMDSEYWRGRQMKKAAEAALLSASASVDVVVWCFLGDLDIVNMGFPNSGRGDFDELRFLMHF